jgi:hypothetical protein
VDRRRGRLRGKRSLIETRARLERRSSGRTPRFWVFSSCGPSRTKLDPPLKSAHTGTDVLGPPLRMCV